ncbi:MAG: 3'-5' exonuclease [Rikenellaceae bacterium]|jgi:DNA polymerase-3 subunit epsilon|nr:3'-5' exonuclease [Rikenellaceae bacterium]
MKNFAAIDFETANSNPSSVCSVGVVVVRDGAIVERIYRLIRPEPEWYSFWNTRVHGLTMADTGNEPVFPHVWSEIAPKIAGLPLVAHNSPFDEGCLRAAHRVYGMDYPDYAFLCTCRASRRVFAQTLTDHKLHTVAAHCGFDLTNHHYALADAEACAEIAIKIL